MILTLLAVNILNFSVLVLGAFVSFAAGLLFLDAWKLNRAEKMPLLRTGGFFGLAVVYTGSAIAWSQPGIPLLISGLKIVALTMILFSLIREPVLHKPELKLGVAVLPLWLLAVRPALLPISAMLFLMIALWYWRRTTEGLDKQLRPAAKAFGWLALGEMISISLFWSSSSQVFWAKLLAIHGPVWMASIVCQLIGWLILGLWVWGYIRFRLKIQLFVTILASVLLIFLLTTLSFSYFLLKNLEANALNHLQTDLKVLQYALDRMQLESLSHATAVASDTSIREALISDNQTQLAVLTSDYLVAQNLSTLVVASGSGLVKMRGENRDNVGDDLADNPLIDSALSGQPISMIVTETQTTTPMVMIRSAVPIKAVGGANVTGAVMIGLAVDEAFVDGVKAVTGLDVTIFAGDTRTATTLVGADNKSRFSGTIEANKQIVETVLGQGQDYLGTTFALNEPYYSAYAPLKTYGDVPVGMLFVGRPQMDLRETAQRSIDLTFMGSGLMMLVFVGPAYLIARYLEENLEA